jgi:hypothetical protein
MPAPLLGQRQSVTYAVLLSLVILLAATFGLFVEVFLELHFVIK